MSRTPKRNEIKDLAPKHTDLVPPSSRKII